MRAVTAKAYGTPEHFKGSSSLPTCPASHAADCPIKLEFSQLERRLDLADTAVLRRVEKDKWLDHACTVRGPMT